MKPTILFIMHLPPPVHGAAMMGQYIHDSRLVNDTFDCHYINLTTAHSLKDIGKGDLSKLGKFAKLLCRIVTTVRRLRPQLVYITPNACPPPFYKDFVVVQTLKLMGCRIVAHYHNKGVATRQNHWLDNKLYRIYFKGLKLILLAEPLYDDVKKYVRRQDIFICPNGIPDTLAEEPSARRNNPVPRLLFLSNLIPSKGVLVLLDACKILKSKGYSFVCDFVGGETAEINAARFNDEAKQRGLNQITVYKGKKYGKDKHDALQQADVFVFPTYYSNECFPLVNLEAMQHKLPVVSTDEGGIPSVVKDGENGLIAKRNDPQSLADCLERLLNNPELREQMGEDGYKKYKEHFTLQTFESNLVKCVKECYKRGGVELALVFYHGKKYGKDKEYFFNQADIFVFPSFYSNETFGLVNLEAMQHKLPVVSTDEGGIPSVVKDGENGLIAKRNDPQSLADCLERLLNSPELREQMGENGYKKYKEHFTLNAFEHNFVQVLKNVTGGGRKARIIALSALVAAERRAA